MLTEPTLTEIWPLWMQRAQSLLDKHAQQINALNVFPVPDSDTGSNMLATVSAAADADPQAGASAALQGARGNSGSLLAVWLRALVKSLGKDGVLTPEALHFSFFTAAASARESLSSPVEGTILLGMDAVARAEIAGELEEHLVFLAETAALAAFESREKLPQAAAAGVADSGAVGFFLVVNALSLAYSERGLAEEKYAELLRSPDRAPSADREAAEGVEVMCTVAVGAVGMAQLRDRLEALGDSISIARQDESGQLPLWAVHVHAKESEAVLAALAEFGEVTNVRVTSLADGGHLHG